MHTYIEPVGGTPTTPTATTPIASILSGFGTHAEREREAIQWVESLSPDEGDRVLTAAREEWVAIVRGAA